MSVAVAEARERYGDSYDPLKELEGITIPFSVRPFNLGSGNNSLARDVGVRVAVGKLAEVSSEHAIAGSFDGTIGVALPHVDIHLPGGLDKDARSKAQLEAQRIVIGLQRATFLSAVGHALDLGLDVKPSFLQQMGVAGRADIDEQMKRISLSIGKRMRGLRAAIAPREVSRMRKIFDRRAGEASSPNRRISVGRDGVGSAQVRTADTDKARAPYRNRAYVVIGSVAALGMACTPILVTERPPIPTPADLSFPNLSEPDASRELAIWQSVTIGETDQMRVVSPIEFIHEQDDASALATLSPLLSDGTVYPSTQWAFATTTIEGADKTQATLPLVVLYDAETGKQQSFGLFKDDAQSTPDKLVFRTAVVDNGHVFNNEVYVTFERGESGYSITVDDRVNKTVYQLVATPSAHGVRVSPTDIPQPILDALVTMLTGAKTALAQVSTPPAPPTATVEATATGEVSYEVIPVYTETIDAEYQGVRMHIEVTTDTSTTTLRYPVEKVYIHETFTNSQGENASESIAHAAAYGIYKAWKLNGSEDQVGSRNNVSFQAYMTMWAECQKGSRDWIDVEYNVVANDLASETYDPEPTTMRPGQVKFVFIDPNSTNNLTDVKGLNKIVYYSFGTHNNRGSLEIWIGYPMQNYDRFGGIVTYYMNMALNRLSLKNQTQLSNPDVRHPVGRMDDPEFSKFLDMQVGYNAYKTVLIVTPDDGDWPNADQ